MKKSRTYQQVIGETIEQMRTEKGWTQEELAEAVGTSQSAIHRIEKGGQNVSLEMVKKLSEALRNQILSINESVSQSYRIRGGKELTGEITVNTSKNAAVALLNDAPFLAGHSTRCSGANRRGSRYNCIKYNASGRTGSRYERKNRRYQ